MGDLRTKLSLDGSDFTRGMDDASKSVEDFTDASKMSASELLNQMKSMDKLGRSTSNYRSQLAQMTKQIQDLTLNYRQMSDEMKNSDFGKAVAAKIEELTAKAGEYKDAIIDAQAAVKTLSSDTAGWDAMKQGIEGVSAGLQIFASSGLLGAQSTEKLVAVLAKLKAIEAATNAVIKIGNLLQRQSALMMGIAKVQALALARAKQLETTATKGATIAQRAFNAVAKANPYVLLAAAVITVVTALATFAISNDKAKKKEEELQRQTERAAEKFNDFKTAVSSAVGKVAGEFANLQRQWKNLSTDSEKNEWIKNNAEEFRKLGLKITDVNTAEAILVDHADDVIAALKAKAKAAATMQLYMDQYTKVVEAQIEADRMVLEAQNIPRTQFTAGNAFGSSIPQEWLDAGLDERAGDLEFKWAGGQSGAGYWTITQKGYDKYIADVRAKGQKLVDEAKMDVADYERMVDEAEREAQAKAEKLKEFLEDPNKGNTPPTTTTTPVKQEVEIVYTEGSYAEAQAMVQKLRKELENLDPSTEEFRAVKFALESWQESLDKISEAMGRTKKETPLVAGSYAEAAAMVAKLTTQLQNLDPSTTEFSNVREELIEWQKTLEEIKALMGETLEETVEEAEELSRVDPFGKWKDALSTVGEMQSAFSSSYSAIKNIGKAFEDCEDPIEAMFSVIDSILSLLNNVTTVLEIINTLEEISVATQLAKNMAEKQETQETIKQAILNTTNLSTEQAEAIAASVKAAAEGANSASKIPYVGWAIAIGAVAAIIAAISSAKSSVHFAQGGIVPGSSFSGDFVNAKLNSGEMVLNKQQQQRLFNMLDSESSGMNGKVEFVIKGQELKGVLNNYDKKMSRV